MTGCSGLSPSTDTAYYQFLLKLGVIRATTWGGKWDLYKTTHTIASRHSPRIKVSSSTNARVAETKARLPFLASASSDLDEGFDDPATYDGDAESLVNVNVLRPSPRKVLAKGDGLDMMSKTDNMDQSRSLVGYTPTSTLDYDAISLNPPIRTSTPVYAQEKGRTTPPLPPYFVSDVGEVFKDMDTASTLDDSNVTLPTRHWTTDEKQLIEEMTREMVTRADEFYQTGLIGRCWDVWTQSFEWVKVCSMFYGLGYEANVLRRKPPSKSILYDQTFYSDKPSLNGTMHINTIYLYLARQIDTGSYTSNHKLFTSGCRG